VSDENALAIARLAGRGRLDAQLRCGRSDGRPGRDEIGHSTPQWAVVWVESGLARLHDHGGSTWELGPDTVFQRLPDTTHDIRRLSATRWWYLALPAACREAARAVGATGLDRQAFIIRRPPGLAQRFRRAALALRSAPAHHLGGSLVELFALGLDLLAAGGTSALHGDAIRRAAELLAEDPLRPWSAAGLARAVGLGEHTFRKSFAATHGCGPGAYRLRLRLDKAQDLLATSEALIPEVAARCGWTDPLQFSAVFRRHLGAPPRTWRRRHA
jgi:AraC-like DNA-binding protein